MLVINKNKQEIKAESLQAAARVMQRCDALALASLNPNHIERTYLSAAHAQANRIVEGWISEAQMESWQDSVGNVWGRYPSKEINAPALIIGSHLDSVVNAGKYDGILGVLLGIELGNFLARHQIDLPFHLDVVGFCDEEGVRFGATLLGSQALTGKWQPEWIELTDESGVSLAEAMIEFGLNPSKVKDAKRDPESIRGFLEVHI